MSAARAEVATVSVVIPVHNRPALLKRAVASALDQSEPVLEVVIVDDASSDETIDVACALARHEARVRVVRQLRNGGACAARNRGILEAQGTFVAFLDSDDEWARGKIFTQMAALRAQPQAIGCFTGAIHKAAGRIIDVRLPPKSISAAELDEANLLGSTSCALVSRAALIDVGLFDPSMVSCQDWDLYLRLVRHGPLVTVREPLIVYDVGDHLRISRNLFAVLEGHRAIARTVAAAQTSARRAARLRCLHAFKEADLVAVVGRDPVTAVGLAMRAFRNHPRPQSAMRFSRLLYRAAKAGFTAR